MAPRKKSKRNYALNTQLDTMNEIEIKEDPDIGVILKSVMDHHNSSAMDLQEEQVIFVEFDKVEYVYACGGTFYFLSIRVQGDVSGNQTTVEKMVWKGTSMEVIETNTKKTIDSSITKSNMEFPAEISKLVLCVCSTDFIHLNLICVHHFEEKEEFHSEILSGGGWFRFQMFDIIIQAKPMEGEVGAKVFIEASVLSRDWLQIMDEKTTSSFRIWKDDMLKAYTPPSTYGSYSESDSIGFPYCPIDLCSPQLLTHAWLAVRDHNYKEGTDLEFVKLVKAEVGPTTGYDYYLTFLAEEFGTLTAFQVVVHEFKSIKSWKPVTLLKHCKVEDEYEIPEPWKAKSICMKGSAKKFGAQYV